MASDKKKAHTISPVLYNQASVRNNEIERYRMILKEATDISISSLVLANLTLLAANLRIEIKRIMNPNSPITPVSANTARKPKCAVLPATNLVKRISGKVE